MPSFFQSTTASQNYRVPWEVPVPELGAENKRLKRSCYNWEALGESQRTLKKKKNFNVAAAPVNQFIH